MYCILIVVPADILLANDIVAWKKVVPNAKNIGQGHGVYDQFVSGHTHFGVDIMAECGSLIYPLFPGKVKKIANNSNGLGYAIMIEHINGLYTIALHMESAPAIGDKLLAVGDDILDDTVSIGKVGETGFADGCHTHFEIRYFYHESEGGGGWYHRNSHRCSDGALNIYACGDVTTQQWAMDDWENPETFIVPENVDDNAEDVTAPHPIYLTDICTASQESIPWWRKLLQKIGSIFGYTANACTSQTTQIGYVTIDATTDTADVTPVINGTAYPQNTTAISLATVGTTAEYAAIPARTGSVPQGSAPQPLKGKRADLRVDFDIYRGPEEVSSNCTNCRTQPLTEGEQLRTVLRAQVANAKVKDSLRKKKSKTIEGYVWCWAEDAAGNYLYDLLRIKESFKVGDLRKGDDPDEEDFFTVPNITAMACRAAIDVHDEVAEPQEGKRKKITAPTDCDKSFTTNNCSRVERFIVLPRHAAVLPQEEVSSQALDATPITGVYAIDPVEWDIDSNGNFFPVPNAVGTLVLASDATAFSVRSIIYDTATLHTRGTDFPVPQGAQIVGACVGVEFVSTYPQTEEGILADPYCAPLFSGVTTNVSIHITITGDDRSALRDLMAHSGEGIVVVLLTTD